jgi:predicted O-methyltransferase YrrM
MLNALESNFSNANLTNTSDLRAQLDSIHRSSHDAVAIQVLAPLSTSYLPWSTSALRPSGLVKILNEIVINRRDTILECGGGISTLYIARLLKQQGHGHLYTLEDNLGWIEVLQNLLKDQGLDDYVTLIPAPLVPCNLALDDNQWYDLTAANAILKEPTIDFLIVDGPPAYDEKRRRSRYPALPELKRVLASDFAIVLDDINRSGEAEIIEKWSAEFGLEFEQYFYDGDIAIARSQGGYHVG